MEVRYEGIAVSMASPEDDRMVAVSLQLAHAHQALRRQIAQLRQSLGRRQGGGLPPSIDSSLTTHCLAFCDALSAHHRGEDEGMFASLLRERPDLSAAIANLVEDHAMIASILSRVRKLAEQALGSHGPALEAIGREFDGLAAIMESHFGYEERAISRALDEDATDAEWSGMAFRFDAAP
jgi:hemerythrin-like domain-containing protein